MSHGETIGLEQARPCWHCRQFVALTDPAASCAHGGRLHARSMPQQGCACHDPDPDRANSPRPEVVSFLDAWRLAPGDIERPPEVLTLMQLEFRVLVCTGSTPEREAFAALDRADQKRCITVVIHAHDALASAWGMRKLREVLTRDDPASARPHAVIALPGGGAWARDVVQWARSKGLPVWAPDRRAIVTKTPVGAPVPEAMPGWRDARQHQWSRDPGRGRRSPPSEG